MCDPVSLALASTAATVVGAGGTLMSSMGAAKAAKKQQQEVLAGSRSRNATAMRRLSVRRNCGHEADKSRQEGLEQLSWRKSGDTAGRRKKNVLPPFTRVTSSRRKDEVGCLQSRMSDTELAAQNTSTTSSDTFKSDLAAAINTATKGARERMAALAGVTSFGSQSLGGLGSSIRTS